MTRRPMAKRLDEGQSEPLAERHVDERTRVPIAVQEVGVARVGEPEEARPARLVRREAPRQRVAAPARAPDQHETRMDAVAPQPFECRENRRLVLPRLERANGEKRACAIA